MIKRTVVTLIILMILISNLSFCYAANDPDPDLWGTAKKWIELGRNNREEINKNNRQTDWSALNDLTGILWGAGIFVILIWGTTLGIRYMFASSSGKAQISKGMTPFLIGSIIIVGALSIWKLLVDLMDGL